MSKVTSTTVSPRTHEMWWHWGANPATIDEAQSIVAEVASGRADLLAEGKTQGINVGIFAPLGYLLKLGDVPELQFGSSPADLLQIGARGVYVEHAGMDERNSTPQMVKGLLSSIQQRPTALIRYRNTYNETPAGTNQTMLSAYEFGVRPFLPTWENGIHRKLRHRAVEGVQERKVEELLCRLETEVQASLTLVSAETFAQARTAILFEQDWRAEDVTPANVNEACGFIRSRVADKYSQDVAEATSIIYSTHGFPEHAETYLAEPHVDGFLINGMGISAAQFLGLIQTVPKMG